MMPVPPLASLILYHIPFRNAYISFSSAAIAVLISVSVKTPLRNIGLQQPQTPIASAFSEALSREIVCLAPKKLAQAQQTHRIE